MKIGIYLGWGAIQPEDGGGYTFQQTLLQALAQLSTTHQWYIFYYGKQPQWCLSDNRIIFVQIIPDHKTIIQLCVWWFRKRAIQRTYKTLLNKSVLDYGIDLMWFMTPGYEYVEVPYLYTVWDLQHRRQSFFPEVSVEQDQFNGREKLYASVIPRAAYVLTGNATAQQEVVHFYNMPAERVIMLELPTPSFALHVSKGVMQWPLLIPHKRYLFYPAQFWPHKNHVVILEALRLLDDDIQVIFTGADKGNLAYVQAYASNLGVRDRVHFLGFVTHDQLIALYHHAQALIFASLFGPNNLPPLEAFALDCPVICADVAGMREQLGEAALFFNPTDEQDLAATITYLLGDEQVRKHFIAMGKDRSLQWTARDYSNAIITLIDQFSRLRRTWGDQASYVYRRHK